MSKDEIDLVGGGDTIVVWGRRYYDPAIFSYPEEGSGMEPHPTLGGSGGGGGPDPYAAADCAKDTAAVDVAEKIKSYQLTIESGGIIHKQADGSVTSSPLSFDMDNDGDVDMTAPGVGYANVLATIHHHSPTGDAVADALYFNVDRYPSHDDWEAFSQLAINVAAAGGSTQMLSMYIVDQSGVVREYTLADRSTYDLPVEQLRGWSGDPTPPPPPPPVQPACS